MWRQVGVSSDVIGRGGSSQNGGKFADEEEVEGEVTKSNDQTRDPVAPEHSCCACEV